MLNNICSNFWNHNGHFDLYFLFLYKFIHFLGSFLAFLFFSKNISLQVLEEQGVIAKGILRQDNHHFEIEPLFHFLMFSFDSYCS